MAQPKAKPLSFSTTIRNPERISRFLSCILPFEGAVLTSTVIHDIIKNVIKDKCYITNNALKNPALKRIYKNEDEQFTDAQLEQIIRISPQKHKEAGFQTGWDSRFDTWYKMIKEFGFINYSMNEPIVVTTTGHMLVDAYRENPKNEKKERMIFLNALSRYYTNNPLRKNLNRNAPLPFLLNVIKCLKEDEEENGAGVARHELPILICWRDNDANAAYNYIKSIRQRHGFNCSDEFIYDKCLDILENRNKKYLKMSQICHEAVDEYIRKMRMTGLVSLRGHGRFIDINAYQQELADYVMDNYMDIPEFDSVSEYVEYMGSIDPEILQIEQESPEIDTSDVKIAALHKYAEEYAPEKIFDELKKVCEKRESSDELLRFINGPTRLEFLTSIALIQNFDNIEILPNYSVDDEGLPTFTAGGGHADIECYDSDYDSYYEVTLMTGRQDQVNDEIIPISRHLRNVIEQKRAESFSVLVAPVIHDDTREAAAWQKHRHHIDILPFTVYEFIEQLKECERPSDMLAMAETI